MTKTKTTVEIESLADQAMEQIKKSVGIPKGRIIDDALRHYLFNALSDDELINRENIRQMLSNGGLQ